jgi:hypothetical protein
MNSPQSCEPSMSFFSYMELEYVSCSNKRGQLVIKSKHGKATCRTLLRDENRSSCS